jgi:hypothetical protein
MTKAKASSRSKPRKRSSIKAKAPQVSRVSSGATKHDRILGLLRTKGGASIAAMSKVTGWQPHSVRGFLAGTVKKKLGLTLTSEKTKSGSIYRISRMKTSSSSPSASSTSEQDDA